MRNSWGERTDMEKTKEADEGEKSNNGKDEEAEERLSTKKKKALNTFKKGRRKDRWNLGTDWYRRICRKAQAILKH